MTMALTSTFYFSRIVGNNVYSDSGKSIGKLKDLVVELGFIRPKVVGIALKTQSGIRTVGFESFRIEKQKGQYVLKCFNLKDINIDNEKTLSIGKYVLDRQIVDMNGRKLVRVNDIRLAILAEGTYLVAVDVGFEGLLRRLGIAKPLKRLMRPFGINIPSHHILWDEVETVDFGHAGIKLSKDYSNLSRLHPSDLADIIEDLDRNTQIAVFSSLDQERAADVLEELEPDVQKIVIENMLLEKAADLLEKMPADEVADILDELREEQAEALLKEMEGEASEEVRELMEYPENTVGSIMTTDYISFNENNTVEETIAELRRLKPEPDTIYYLYILNTSGKLISIVSLRDVIVAEPQTRLSEIMNKDIIFVYDKDKIDSLNEIIAKYSLLAVPVADEDKIMIGVVIINDIMYNLLKTKRKRL
jgi:CBS domain-containing protein/sporulation protein YlmC with PRC-barrel domain